MGLTGKDILPWLNPLRTPKKTDETNDHERYRLASLSLKSINPTKKNPPPNKQHRAPNPRRTMDYLDLPPIQNRPYLPPPPALAPALSRYRANLAARKLRQKNEPPAPPFIKTVLVRQLKKRDHILIRGTPCQIISIADYGIPRDWLRIVAESAVEKRRLERVLRGDWAVGVSNYSMPEGVVLEVSVGVVEGGDVCFFFPLLPLLYQACYNPSKGIGN